MVLFIPTIAGPEGGVHQIGVVRSIYPQLANESSKILWPKTPHDRLFPYLFFFNTEIGFRPWHEFLKDVGIASNWDPKGWYRVIANHRFDEWGGPQGYLLFLRERCGFDQRQLNKLKTDIEISRL